MPSSRHTRVEITPEAYLALEAESILQGKTLKKLASELIMMGVSDKALEFIQQSTHAGRGENKKQKGGVARAIKQIGNVGIHIDEAILENTQRVLLKEGYNEAKLYVAQHTASVVRDELHRVLTICDQYMLAPEIAADIIVNLNEIESGA